MALKVGNDHKFYYNSGTNDSPTWVEICIIGDMTVDLNVSDAEVDLRCSPWVLNLPAKHTGNFNFFLASSQGYQIWQTLRSYYFARTITQYASASGAIAVAGTEYFKAYGHFSAFPWAQPTQEIGSHDATLSLSWKEDSNGAVINPSWNVAA